MVKYNNLTGEEKEYYKDVAHYGNEYLLRMLDQHIEEFRKQLIITGEDYFLSLKHELHMYAKVVKVRWEEVKESEKLK